MSAARPLRIGLFGQFGIGNLGNEGSLEAMLRFLRAHAPDAELVCICSDPDFVTRTYGINAVRLQTEAPSGAAGLVNRALLGMPSRIANIGHALKHAGKLDVLLIPGTGILDDFGASPTGLPYELWRWCHAAKLGGAKIGFVSIGAGPIVHPLSRMLMKSAARTANYRSYRDLPSKAFVNAIRMRTPQDPVFPDLAFSLPTPPSTPRAPHAPLTVAVGVMAYFGWSGAPDEGRDVYANYIAKLSDYVVWLLQSGHRVKFVIGKDKDVDAVADVKARVLEKAPDQAAGLDPFEPAVSLHDVMRQMEAADIAVVTRFHNLVSALHVGRACISLGYARKNHALLEEMGLGAFSREVESYDLAKLKADTERLIATRAEHEAAISRQVASYETQLKAQERLLSEEFLRAQGSIRMARPAGMEAETLSHPIAR